MEWQEKKLILDHSRALVSFVLRRRHSGARTEN
jgi:hypothetical protein